MLPKGMPHLKLFILFIVTSIFSTACLQNDKNIGVLTIRQNLDQFEAQTRSYNEHIKFEISTRDIRTGVQNPYLITSIHNTSFYVTEITERDDSIYIMNVGLKYKYQSPEGTMLSLFQLNDNNTYTSGGFTVKVYDEKGEILGVAGGSGDGEKYEYEQWFGVQIPSEIVLNNNKLSS